jgi:hypothetical protein
LTRADKTVERARWRSVSLLTCDPDLITSPRSIGETYATKLSPEIYQSQTILMTRLFQLATFCSGSRFFPFTSFKGQNDILTVILSPERSEGTEESLSMHVLLHTPYK